jgi:hypothetical protein
MLQGNNGQRRAFRSARILFKLIAGVKSKRGIKSSLAATILANMCRTYRFRVSGDHGHVDLAELDHGLRAAVDLELQQIAET